MTADTYDSVILPDERYDCVLPTRRRPLLIQRAGGENCCKVVARVYATSDSKTSLFRAIVTRLINKSTYSIFL